ncbi:mucin-5AC-like [Photinus pyralis]|nr:mucin-5AC-like [Photinus pyralis]
MGHCHRIFFILSVLLNRWLMTTAQENYFLGTPRFPQTYHPTSSEFNTLRKTPLAFGRNSFIPSSDLDTSDLPSHLQRRLPQYQFSSFENSGEKFPPQLPSFAQQISPSTHRPSYSHLFSKNSHNHDPSQTETFLGEITIQSPAELPIEFKNRNIGGFQPSLHFPVRQFAVPNKTQNTNGIVDQHLDSTPTNHYTGSTRANFLNHRTRIFAPATGNRPEVNDYFVNTNGDVFVTTKRPEHDERTTTHSEKHDEVTTPDTRTVENTFNLDSLLEEPVDKSEPSSNKDNVEVIKAVTVSPDKFYLPDPNVTSSGEDYMATDDSEDYDYDTTALYDEETTTAFVPDSEETTESTELNSVDGSKIVNPPAVQESGYEVLTMKPATMVKDDNFKKFVDSSVIDTDPPPPRVKDLEDTVISVVTTKSIINNTLIDTLPSNYSVTEQMVTTSDPNVTTESHLQAQLSAPKHTLGEEEVSTEGWVVVASVQTSRSVSGARYLPFPVVEQHERTKLLNEREKDEEEAVTFSNTTVENESTTISSSEKQNTSTESLTDKLDRVQSDLSGSLLTGSFNNEASNIAVITEGQLDKSDETTMFDSPSSGNVTSRPSSPGSPPVVIRKFSPLARPSTTARSRMGLKPRKVNSPVDIDKPQSDQPVKLYVPDIKLKNGTTGRSSGISNQNQIIVQDVNQRKEAELSQKTLEHLLHKIKFKETSALLPPDYHEKIVSNASEETNSKKMKPAYGTASSTASPSVFDNIKQADVGALLPPGYNSKQNDTVPKSDSKTTQNKTDALTNLFKKVKQDDIAAFLPPGYKPPSDETPKNRTIDNLLKKSAVDNISAFLPPGYKPPSEDAPKNRTIENLLKKSVVDDLSAFLPPGYKQPKSTTVKTPLSIIETATQDDVSAFLPPGYKVSTPKADISSTSAQPKSLSDIFESAKQDDISAFLPPGFKSKFGLSKVSTTTEVSTTTTTEKITTTTAAPGFKLVFPSRPGGAHRKNTKASGSRSNYNEPANTPPSIHKGWPTRATTEFTGWPTPSTTPLSIEKILERARAAAGATSSTTTEAAMSTPSTSTTTTSTTTTRPTTPGLCLSECDLVGTIKLTGGAKWAPELLDRNTKEWQLLANEVQYQLEDIYSKSDVLSKWYKKIRIDGFTKGSVLVDYVVELSNVSREVSTTDLKSMFNDALQDALAKSGTNREAKSSDLRSSLDEGERLSLGNFIIDPTYTDFVVLPKQILPTVGYAEDNVLLPQWAIAIIVIGLASLLFVIIFGVTVIVNKQKNAKKKQPSTLTEEMLNELNKNHMGGIDNYGADDLYNMEDVWNDKPYETKLPKKRSAGSLHDNSMPNIYDSWRSEWNGYYYNTYYGNHPGSSHSGYGRRRSDYDTNF